MMSYLPNIITLIRIVLMIPYLYCLYTGKYLAALSIFMFAGMTDALDGFLARHFSWTSTIGAVLDPLADKLLMISSLTVMYLIGSLDFWIPCLLIGRDLIIICGVLFLYFCNITIKFKSVLSSKINTVLQLFLIFILLIHLALYPIPDELISITIILVLLTSLISTWQYIVIGCNLFIQSKRI